MYTKPLVIAATLTEIAPSIPLLDQYQIPYIITGVGMVATAYTVTKALYNHKPSFVLNIGIAGSLSRDIPIGYIVEIVQDTLYELGAENGEEFIPMSELGFGESSWPNRPPQDVDTHLHKVNGITVNKVHGNSRSIQDIKQRLPEAGTESMEGAAVFYVCAQENIPCIQVRSISNYVEMRDKLTWDIPLAIQNLHIWLSDFLQSK